MAQGYLASEKGKVQRRHANENTGYIWPGEKEMSPGDSMTLTDFMPVIFPLIPPAGLSPVKPPSSEPTFDPLDFQPVSDQGDIQHSHWSSSYITPLSLVQSSRVLKYFHPLKGIFPAPRWFFMA